MGWNLKNASECEHEVHRSALQKLECGNLEVCHPRCVRVWKLERVCSQTQLYQLRCFNDYTITQQNPDVEISPSRARTLYIVGP